MSKPTRFVVVPAGVANDLREFCKIVDSCSDGVAIYSTFKARFWRTGNGCRCILYARMETPGCHIFDHPGTFEVIDNDYPIYQARVLRVS